MKKTFCILLALLVLITITIIAFPSVLLKYQPIEKKLKQKLESVQGSILSYKDISYSFFPFFEIHLSGVVIQSNILKELELTTDDVSMRIARLPMIFGELSVDRLRFDDDSLILNIPSNSVEDLISC